MVSGLGKGILKRLLPNLKGRTVFLFPDASSETYYEWKAIADEARDLYDINVTVSDILCSVQGKEDIADFLLQAPISIYRKQQPEPEQLSEQLPEQLPERLPERLNEPIYSPEVAALISVLDLEIITGEEIKPVIDFEEEEKQRIKEFWQQYEGLQAILPEQVKPEILIVQKMLKAWGGEMDLQQARIELPVRLRQYGIEASADSALQLAVKERYIDKHAFKYSLCSLS